MLIGELATASGLTRETLRFYEKLELIRSTRNANGYREYAVETLLLVRYIRTAQAMGFTLAEIGHRLPELWASEARPGTVELVLQEKLRDVDARIEALQALRGELSARLSSACPLRPLAEAAHA